MLAQLQLTTVIWTVITSMVLYVIYQFYMKPFLSILDYKKQGGASLFYWKLVSFFDDYENALKRGDFFLAYKELLKKNPQAKFITENFGSRVHIILTQPEMIKEALRRYDVYQKDEKMFKGMAETVKGSMVFAEGEDWRKKRKIVSSAFNFESLKHVVPIVISTSQEKFSDWMVKRELKDINLVKHMGMITGEVTGKFFFGKNFGDKKIKEVPLTSCVQDYVVQAMDEAMSITGLVFGPNFSKYNILARHQEMNRNSENLRAVFKEMIREAEENPKNEDNLLSVYLNYMKTLDTEDGQLTHDEIVGEFFGIFAAGTDTISHSLASTMYFLFKYPEVFARVKEEVDREFSDLDKIDISTMNRMEYTTAVFKESLRLGGPVASLFDRTAVKDDDLCGVKIRKGDMVLIFQGLFFTDEKFFKQETEFIPERWLNNEEFNQEGSKKEPYSYLPFSAGPRNCLGQHLAMIEAKIVLALFIKTFKFEFSPDFKFDLVQRFTFETYDPILVSLQPLSKI